MTVGIANHEGIAAARGLRIRYRCWSCHDLAVTSVDTPFGEQQNIFGFVFGAVSISRHLGFLFDVEVFSPATLVNVQTLAYQGRRADRDYHGEPHRYDV